MLSNYDTDVMAWAFEQAGLIRLGRLDCVDLEHVAEEIENMGNEQKVALQSLLRQIVVHLLKLQYSRADAPRLGWIEEVIEFRDQAQTRIEDVPSLKHHINELFPKACAQALRATRKAMEMYGESVTLPQECPYSLEQVLDPDFFPQR